MNGPIRFVVLFFAINFSVLSLSVKSQSLKEIVDFADQQYDTENFKSAINEYNRALFFGSQNQDRLYLNIAYSYFNLKDFDRSIVFFDKTFFNTQSDSIKNEAVLGKSFSLILENQYLLALSELMNIDTTRFKSQNSKTYFLQGIAYFGLHEDKLAEKSFILSLAGIPKNSNENFIKDKFALLKKNERRFNPRIAWFMSLILPGSGQFYAKEYKETLNSSLLLGGLFYLAVSYATNISVLEALFVMLPWVQRYYLGGATKAEKMTLDRQLENRNNLYISMVDFIEYQYVK